MSRTVFLACLVMLLAAYACKKEDQTADYTPVESDYTNLKIGNYWVYQYYKIDSTGAEQDLNETDIATISGDTVINGKTYLIRSRDHLKSGEVFSSPQYDQYLRDSSGYLVDHTGAILFARDNFTDILARDTIGDLLWGYTKMTGKDSLVTVPAGTFTTRSTANTWIPQNPDYPYGIRKSLYTYGKNTGLIKYNYWYFSASWYYEARLVRFGKN